MALCACGACRRCQCRRARARYRLTAKGQATEARYWANPRGQRTKVKNNARRIYLGADYRGLAANAETAAVIQTHIKERVREFKQRQSSVDA